MTHLRLLTCGLIVLGLALTHARQESASPELDQEAIEQLVTIAETLQTDLPADIPVLVADALASDWFRWLASTLQLDSYDKVQDLAAILSNYHDYASGDDGVANWLSHMEHLVMLYDAWQQGFSQEQAEVLLEDLEAADDVAAVQLSYRIMLSTIDPAVSLLIAPVASRLARLIVQAQGRN